MQVKLDDNAKLENTIIQMKRQHAEEMRKLEDENRKLKSENDELKEQLKHMGF